jgi:Protein of unknown function (DUF2975)
MPYRLSITSGVAVTNQNPLAPLERIIALIGGLIVLGLLLLVPATLLGSGSLFGYGDSVVCVDTPLGGLDSHHGTGVRAVHVRGLAPGISANATRANLCDNDPSARQRLLLTLTELPQFLFLLGFIATAWRLTRRVRQRGLFMPEVATTLARLGVYLFFGEFVVMAVEAVAAARLVSSMVATTRDSSWAYHLHFSGAVIIAAFGLQAMSRVMRVAVPMREEIDATV